MAHLLVASWRAGGWQNFFIWDLVATGIARAFDSRGERQPALPR
jgi:hypothetical protein